ncbi:MAG: hypothetical protein JXA20_14130 [Spirochaetes bacterium]|nr:hypothetical protein [Spirochaetota bacterium]
MRIYSHVYIILALLLLPAFSMYGEAEGTGNEEPRKAAASLRTLLLGLRRYDCPLITGERITRDFRTGLSSLPDCELIDGSGSGAFPCHDAECAVRLGKAAGAHRALYGYVSRKTDVEKKRLGATGAKKYIIRTERHETFTIGVKLVDVGTGTPLAELVRKSPPEDLDATIHAMVAELAPHFGPRQVSGEVTAPEGDEGARRPESIRDDSGGDERDDEDGTSPEFALGIYFSFMVPVGAFRDITAFGLGNGLEARMRNLPFRNAELGADLEFCYYASVTGSVVSYRNLRMTFNGGYRIEVLARVSLTPLLGIGYVFHFVNKNLEGGMKTFSDPCVSIRLGLDIGIIEGLSLTASPGYVICFEKGAACMFPVLQLGMRYAF